MAYETSDFQKLLGRALTDERFRTTLRKDPTTALKECGIDATPEKIAALKSASESLAKTQKAFGGRPRYC